MNFAKLSGMSHAAWLGAVILFGCAPITVLEPTLPNIEDMRIKAINVPAVFNVHPYDSPVMLFSINGAQLDPLSELKVNVRLLDARGVPVEAPFTNSLTVQDIALDDGVVGIVLTDLPGGAYRICADIERIADVVACVPFRIVLLTLAACDQAVDNLINQNANFACKCVMGGIRHAAADAPDGTLGSFVRAAGGNTFGSHKNGRVGGRLTSIFKFEPHFTVEFVNEPAKPAACTDDEWFKAKAAKLCDQGQNISATTIFRVGAANEILAPKKVGNDSFPYTVTRTAANFTKDGHGSKKPATAANGTALQGAQKSHDAPDLLHWLDAPGYFDIPAGAVFNRFLPQHTHNYFHTYVHGSTGREEDNCDCYFGVKTGVINAAGRAEDASLLTVPQCR